MTSRHRAAAAAVLAAVCGGARAGAGTVELDALTSTELAARVAAGTHTVLLPIGGTEQNGAHLALGKHNVRVRALAHRVAERLGDAVVAPVLAYVPEGAIDPPSEHMRHAGTISVPAAAFESLLDGAARSLCRHGLTHVVLLGDHGGYRASLERVARRLVQPSCRVQVAAGYYRAATQDFAAWLRRGGYSDEEIGRHAGLADTALAWAVDAALVRHDQLAAAARQPGVAGDPRRAAAALGQWALEHIVTTTVDEVRAAAAPAR